jgi:Mn-dependent DtxR family transcriptional regulator
VVISAFLGLFAAVLGLVASIVFETTPGPAMAVAATLVYLLISLIAPKKGVIAKFLTRKGQQRKVELEDTLKEAFKQQSKGEHALSKVSERLRYPHRKTRRLASALVQRKLLSLQKDQFRLTDEGVKKANSLIRAHRLWETYLVNQVGLEAQQIHEDAERLEHLLSEELLDEVDQELGYPTLDPHGSPIPRKANGIQYPLNRLDINESATISELQPVDRAARILWEHGLEPHAVIEVTSTAPDHITMTSGGQSIRLSMKDARIINVEPLVHSSSEPI